MSKKKLYISAYQIPHPTDRKKVFPAGVAFELSDEDLEDAFIALQIKQKVFVPIEPVENAPSRAPTKGETKKQAKKG